MRLFDPTPNPETPAGGAAPSPAPSTPETPAPDAPSTPETPDLDARMKAAFDAAGYNDEQRATAYEYLKRWNSLDPAQQAEYLAASVENDRRLRALQSQPAEPKPAPKQPDPDDDAPKPDPEIAALKKQIASIQAALNNRERAENEAAIRKAWEKSVRQLIDADPVLSDRSEKAKKAMVAGALGYVYQHAKSDHGGSQQAALKAFLEAQAELVASGKGVGVKEFIESKAKAREATGEVGAGRPPAMAAFTPSADALKNDEVLLQAAADLNVKL